MREETEIFEAELRRLPTRLADLEALMIRNGIRGVACAPCLCPLAEFVFKQTGIRGPVFHTDDKPRAILEFVRRFDRFEADPRLYPEICFQFFYADWHKAEVINRLGEPVQIRFPTLNVSSDIRISEGVLRLAGWHYAGGVLHATVSEAVRSPL